MVNYRARLVSALLAASLLLASVSGAVLGLHW
jgi:hypothetical protein